MTKASNASGNAVLAKARALYGRRLRAEDYRRLMGCRTMSELAAALKEQPLYSAALADVNPQYARRAQLESLLHRPVRLGKGNEPRWHFGCCGRYAVGKGSGTAENRQA